jgi:phosphoglycerol transferase
MSIIIAFAGLAVLALAGDRLLRGRRRRVRWALLGLVVAVGLVDQLPPIDSAKRHEEIAEYGRDAAFFDVLESSLPPAAAVFELPAVPYPEHPQVYDLEDYELMRGYFHTDRLRFSYGALKTRVPPWDRELQCRSLSELLAGAVVAGFDALYVDTLGWPETTRGAVEPTVNEVLGGPIVRTDDGRMVAWDLGDLRERLADDPPADLDGLRDAVLAGVDSTHTDLTAVARSLGLPTRTAPLVACPAP